jgi:hypothetical protein
MNWKNNITAIAVAALATANVALAHDPRFGGHDPEEDMVRVPIQIQPATPPPPPPAPPKIRFAEMDKDGDRRITRKEWAGKGSAFRKLDKNKDGVLSGAEVEIPMKAPAK